MDISVVIPLILAGTSGMDRTSNERKWFQL